MAILSLVTAVAFTVLVSARLDSLAHSVPGVWGAGQLVPVNVKLFYGISTDRDEVRARAMKLLLASLSPSSAAVTVGSRPGGRLVSVGVAEVHDPGSVARRLNAESSVDPELPMLRAWTEGNRFVVVLSASLGGDAPGLGPNPAAEFAKQVSKEVKATIRAERFLWYLGGVLVTTVALCTAAEFVYGITLILMGRRPMYWFRARKERKHPVEDIAPPSSLSSRSRIFDLNTKRFVNEVASPELLRGMWEVPEVDEGGRIATPVSYRTNVKGGGTFSAFALMAVAIPALTPMWWPDSLFWSAVVGEWLLVVLVRRIWARRPGTQPPRTQRASKIAQWGLLIIIVLALGPAWTAAVPAIAGVSLLLSRIRRRWNLAGTRFSMFLGFVQCGLAVLTIVAIARAHLSFSPSGVTHTFWLAGLFVVVAISSLTLYWRRAISSLWPFSVYLEPSWLASVYLLSGLVILLGSSCLVFGSDVDPFLLSELVSKAAGICGALVITPILVRRYRAAARAFQRSRARARGDAEVVLLRAFADDNLRVRSTRQFRTFLEGGYYRRTEPFEDVVVRAFEAIGPVVAIAKPGTVQREFGAARQKVVNQDWLTAVKVALNSSALVVVILGPGEGLTTELRTLRDLNLLDRVCLIVPPVTPSAVANRLAYVTCVLDGPEEWGTLDTDVVAGGRVLALVGLATNRVVVVWDDRRTPARYKGSMYAAVTRDSSEAVVRLGAWMREWRQALQPTE